MPFSGRDSNVARIPRATYEDKFFTNARDPANLAVEVPSFRLQVILDEHDLSTPLELQRMVRGIRFLWKIAHNGGLEDVAWSRKLAEVPGVDIMRDPIGRSQRDVGILAGRSEIRDESAVEFPQRLLIETVDPHLVQQRDELRGGLTVNMFQFDRNVVGLAERTAAEEIGCIVELGQHVPILLLYDRRQLVQVADHQQLHTAKRPAVVAEVAQHLVDGVEHIRADHTDLVDHK